MICLLGPLGSEFTLFFSSSGSDGIQWDECILPVLRRRETRNRLNRYSRRELHMEEMYEVLKFIDHGARCRQGMDCVPGKLLIHCIGENPRLDKKTVFEWFRQLAVCVDQFYRCRNRRNYRYLNPYSIVISDEGRLFLLDLESQENAFVMKQMQKRAVRNHFVKPVYDMGITKNQDADLFAYGRTVQFILACSEITPKLRRREEARFERLIRRCTGESKKKYAEFSQVLRDLPPVPAEIQSRREKSGKGFGMILAEIAAAAVLGLLIGLIGPL